jgi:hypothetical protein
VVTGIVVTVVPASTPNVAADPRATGAWTANASWRANITASPRQKAALQAIEAEFLISKLFFIYSLLCCEFTARFYRSPIGELVEIHPSKIHTHS